MLLNEQRYEDCVFYEQESDHDKLLTRAEAALYLRVAVGTLAVWDCTKRYNLKPIKIGRAVRYRKSVLDKFLCDRLKR